MILKKFKRKFFETNFRFYKINKFKNELHSPKTVSIKLNL